MSGEASPRADDVETLPGNLGSGDVDRSSFDLRRGEPIGRYVILRRIGAGGMGIVYAAYDPELDRTVALKLLQDSYAAHSLARARFLREAQSMAKLNHPNVAIVHDVGSARGRAYLAMELVPGPNLHAWRHAEQRSVGAILDVYIAAGRGIAAAHEKGIVHRDFKPDNVLIGEDGRVRVMDFGLARAAHPSAVSADTADVEIRVSGPEGDVGLTQQGDLVGTPAYMAPEQFARQTADARSDQFSFCVALWEALYGARPYGGGNEVELVNAFEAKTLAEPSPGSASVPAWLHDALARGLSIEPERRWPSMAALLAELGRNRRRKRVILALASTAAIGAAAFGGWHLVAQQRALRACERDAAAIEADWSARVAEDLRGALTGLDDAPRQQTWQRLADGLDAYTHEWTQLRSDACLAARRDGDDPETYALAGECLDERRTFVAQVVSMLEGADLPRLNVALSMLPRLPRLDRCADERWLAQRVRPPDGIARDEITRVRAELAEVWVLRLAGRFDDATRAADRALDEAEALGWAPLVAEAATSAGSAHTAAGHYDRAETLLRRAYMEGGAAGQDEAALDAALGLVHLLGALLQRHDDAELWGELAASKLERLGGDDLPRQAELLIYLGSTRTSAARYEEAEEALQRALALDAGPNVESTARVNLGLLYFEQGRHDDALAQFYPALAQREAVLGEYHPDVARVLNNIGSALASKAEYEKALVYLERALAVMEVATGGNHPMVANMLGNIAGIHLHLGRPEEALPRHQRAVEIADATYGRDSAEAALAHGNLANTLATLGRFDEARPELEHAIAATEAKLGRTHPGLANLLDNYGKLLLDMNEPAAAVDVFRRVVDLLDAQDKPHPNYLATALVGLGHALVRTGAPAAAIPHLERALVILDIPDARPELRDHARKVLTEARAAMPEKSN